MSRMGRSSSPDVWRGVLANAMSWSVLAAISATTVSTDSTDVPLSDPGGEPVVVPFQGRRVFDNLAAKPSLEAMQTSPIVTLRSWHSTWSLNRRLGILHRDPPEIVPFEPLVPGPPHGLELQQKSRSMGAVFG